MSASPINEALHRACDAVDEALSELHGMLKRAREDDRIDDVANLGGQVRDITRAGRTLAEHITDV